MHGYLLFALQPSRRVSMGDNVPNARKAGRPSSRFEICHSGVKGIRPTSPAPPINAKTGAATKKNLSAFLGMNNSLKANLIRSAKDWRTPPSGHGDTGHTRICTIAALLHTTQMNS